MEIINMWAWQDTCSGFNGWDEQWNTVVKVNFIFCVKVFVTSFKIFYFLYFLFSHNLMIMFFNWNSSNVFFCHFQLSVFNFYLVIHELHIFYLTKHCLSIGNCPGVGLFVWLWIIIHHLLFEFMNSHSHTQVVFGSVLTDNKSINFKEPTVLFLTLVIFIPVKISVFYLIPLFIIFHLTKAYHWLVQLEIGTKTRVNIVTEVSVFPSLSQRLRVKNYLGVSCNIICI